MDKDKQLAEIPNVQPSTMRLISTLEKGNRVEMNMILREYKTEKGAVNFNEVLKIPSSDRICGLVTSVGYNRICTMLTAGIQVAMESLNLSRPLTADQTVDLADAIIETSQEDNLSVQDVVLFLQKIVRGETGTLYSSMDIAKFMTSFEVYRQERHETMLHIKEEQNAQFKVMGREDRKRTYQPGMDRGDIDSATFFDLMQSMNMKDETDKFHSD